MPPCFKCEQKLLNHWAAGTSSHPGALGSGGKPDATPIGRPGPLGGAKKVGKIKKSENSA